MTSPRLPRARRLAGRVFLLLPLLVILAGAAACPFAGRYLIVDDQLQKTDAIIVLAGNTWTRTLEASDLYREGYAPRLVLSPGQDDRLERELRARGLPIPVEPELQRTVLRRLQVPETAIEILPGHYDNTAAEAAGVRRLAGERGWQRVIVVTSRYHTRRTRFAFERAFDGSGAAVLVRGSRHDDVQPDGWWRSRSDARWVTSELQKLLAYRLGLSR